MRLTYDLRQGLGVVLAQAHSLWRAMEALPPDEMTMQEALDRMTPTERRQTTAYLTMLGQRCGQIRERCLWLKRYFDEGQT